MVSLIFGLAHHAWEDDAFIEKKIDFAKYPGFGANYVP